jgi:maltooligosyltrehalose trehalohydrolase
VRRFFIENALYWQSEFHMDGLRLDAVHAIRDFSAVPFLLELRRETSARAIELKRPFHLIAESDLNAPRFILPERLHGYGLDAQWADDFHHCLHVLLTGETCGYYEDYVGGLDQFAKVWRNGFAYTGEYSTYRKMRHGSSTEAISFKQLVVCAQNHDQVGNRMKGERLSNLLDLESLKLAAGCVLFSPFIPLLFMGEEYGETAPFQYFVDHGDEDLLKAVQHGRTAEFAAFEWQGEVPDPTSESTFLHSRLNHSLREKGDHRKLLQFYRIALALRKSLPCFAEAERDDFEISTLHDAEAIMVRFRGERPVVAIFGFARSPARVPVVIGQPEVLLNSADAEWGGPGKATAFNQGIEISPRSVLLLRCFSLSVK